LKEKRECCGPIISAPEETFVDLDLDCSWLERHFVRIAALGRYSLSS
jgi:hypothetical protein